MSKKFWTIGSAGTCDLIVEGPEVAPRHCRLSTNGKTIMLRDLKTVSGTFVNGERISGACTISIHDQVTVGPSTLMPWPPDLQTGPVQPVAEIDESCFTVGRHPESTVVLQDGSVSTRHARLTEQGDGTWLLEDLGSTNGTSVSVLQNKVRTATVSGTDVIYLGSVEITFADLLMRARKGFDDQRAAAQEAALAADEEAERTRDREARDAVAAKARRRVRKYREAQPSPVDWLMKPYTIIGGIVIMAIVIIVGYSLSGKNEGDKKPEQDPPEATETNSAD